MKLFNFCFIFIACILISACSQSDSVEVPKISKVEKLIKHSEEFNKEVLTYQTPGGRVHIAIGFGIANSIMVEGIDGNIIIDSADSVFEAEEIYSFFKKKNSNPIKAVIYTHNHGDHTFGTSFYLTSQPERPKIIAHESTDYYMQRILGIINPIVSVRSARMFGTQLPEEDLINVGIGKSLNVSKSPPGYVKPDTTFKDKLILDIAGIDIQLFYAPGETNDQLFVWLPKHESLMPGDNIYKTFPNLYTIRGTTHRDVMGWIGSLDHMRRLDPKFLFPSHTKPIVGPDVSEVLTLYRDAIQFVHDQTVRLMNEGYYPDQIVDMIDLPIKVKESPFLYEFYGTVRWSVKSIFNGYLGWFNGNPSDLDPLSRIEEAKQFSKLAGGNEELLKSLNTAIAEEDMQWALQLSDRLIALEFMLDETRALRKKALIYIGERSSNPNKRNYFLTSAIELDESFDGFPVAERSLDLINEISTDTFFNLLSVRLNPENIYKNNYVACFVFTSGLVKTITIRNDVAEISNKLEECNITVKSDESELKLALSGLKNPVQSIASGDIEVVGGRVEFLQFLASFK